MRRVLSFAIAMLLACSFARFDAALSSVLLGQAAAQSIKVPVQDKAPPKTPDACAVVSASSRAEGYGYKHIVTLDNRCDKTVLCEVSTDVDPTPRHTLIAGPGQSADVVTRIGSPARGVTAQKVCRFN